MLSQWGMWAYQNRGLSLDFPSMEPFTRMRPQSTQGIVIDDDEGVAIDRIVSLLKNNDPTEHDALARYYLAGQSYRDIAKAYGHRDHKRVALLVTGGRRFIDGILQVGPHYHETY